jgi:hypothetical protein
VKTERLADGHLYWRIAEASWTDPLDPSFARERGGRWNPPKSHPTLYLNEDLVTSRLNLKLFIARWPYEPEDLRDESGPVLVGATLPGRQVVADQHTPEGLARTGLPATYPTDDSGEIVAHATCQPIGLAAFEANLRGVRCRSARTPQGAGRELAWFPATRRSRARRITTLRFEAWYWG